MRRKKTTNQYAEEMGFQLPVLTSKSEEGCLKKEEESSRSHARYFEWISLPGSSCPSSGMSTEGQCS